MTRKKELTQVEVPTKLKRVLSLFDLVMLGIGSTLGLGAYVLSGSIAKLEAGPAACISFLIAAVSSFFSGLCYAEFAARVPKAGSAYVYSYVTVGEFAAFIIGWNLVLEYVIATWTSTVSSLLKSSLAEARSVERFWKYHITFLVHPVMYALCLGGASVARGLSNYIDVMADKAMQKALTKALPLPGGYMGNYPDFLASGFLILGTLLLAWGVKESSFLNKVCTVINLITITISVVTGLIYADIENWNKPRSAIPSPQLINSHLHNFGTGGFLPYGFNGVMAGAARAFYGFVGFDCLATTAEEAKNPRRDIPLSIIISLLVILASYFSMSIMVTLAIPYYEQDHEAPLPHIFKQLGLYEIRWVISLGAISALTTNIIGCLFPLPRVLYSMACDRLIFFPLSYINGRTHTPVVAIFLGGGLAATMSCLLDIRQLIDMMSIGTLMAFSIVSLCILIIRYGVNQDTEERTTQSQQSNNGPLDAAGLAASSEPEETTRPRRSTIQKLWNNPRTREPNKLTQKVAYWSLAVYVISALALSLILAIFEEQFQTRVIWLFVLVGVIFCFIIVSVAVLARQPKNEPQLTFKVPLMPFIPLASIITNMSLMTKLDYHTWVRLLIWLVVGMLIYVLYGITHSKEGSTFKRRTTPEGLTGQSTSS